MKAFDGYKAEAMRMSEPLPAGGYVAKIMGAEVKYYTWGEQLVISFDIAEGDHKNHFAEEWKNNQNEEKKWKGNYRLTVPDERNQRVDSQKRQFGNAMWAIEQSNPGYHWDWDETGLKGKTVGVLFRNREWEFNGSTGWTTECGMFLDAQSVRDGKYKPMKDRPLKKSAQESTTFTELPAEDDADLPF